MKNIGKFDSYTAESGSVYALYRLRKAACARAADLFNS
jgi:hypothetical protein